VWRLTDTGARLEFGRTTGTSAPNAGWGASEPRWLDGRTIEFTRSVPVDLHGVDVTTPRARLTLGENGWQLDPPDR
jgi:hypothetical protein